MQVLKQRYSRKIPDKENQFWQRRFYDFNVFTDDKRIEKLRYIHRNPVNRGLVKEPDEWAWSSFRAYASGKRNCQSRRMSVIDIPPFAKTRRMGHPAISFGTGQYCGQRIIIYIGNFPSDRLSPSRSSFVLSQENSFASLHCWLALTMSDI